MSFDFRGTALELCSRPGCVHYRAEHEDNFGHCTDYQRQPWGIGLPGGPGVGITDQCSCPEFVPETRS
jgi:hypothetical protein